MLYIFRGQVNAGWNPLPASVLQTSGITPVATVPIPTTAYLIVSGLIPFIRLRRKGRGL